MKSTEVDQGLFTDSYCKVCSAQLISESQRVAHYEVRTPTHMTTWPPATFHTLSDWMRGSRPPERLPGSQHLSPAADSHTVHLSGTAYLFHQTLMIETEDNISNFWNLCSDNKDTLKKKKTASFKCSVLRVNKPSMPKSFKFTLCGWRFSEKMCKNTFTKK